MDCAAFRKWLSLACFLQLFASVACSVDITFPVSGMVYPSVGPDLIAWNSGPDDPAQAKFYLVTYDGDEVVNYLYAEQHYLGPGSVEIRFQSGAPYGTSWTWQLYDASQSVMKGINPIAESAHFRIQGSILPLNTKGLSKGGAAGVAILVIIIFGLLGLFWYRFFYQPWKQHQHQQMQQQSDIARAPYLVEGNNGGKPELDGNQAATSYNNSTGNPDSKDAKFPHPAVNVQEFHSPTYEMGGHPVTSYAWSSPTLMSPVDANDSLPITHHEMQGYSQSTLPAYSKELPANNNQEMQSYSQINRPAELQYSPVSFATTSNGLPFPPSLFELSNQPIPQSSASVVRRKEIGGVARQEMPAKSVPLPTPSVVRRKQVGMGSPQPNSLQQTMLRINMIPQELEANNPPAQA